ncbi:TFIIB-type zinc ribbon-containing protein [Streptomyces sp. HUAS TT20]|uniref:TFIIB-type zinc ribbon-containing protein n=1 Tax=Streptomyces sp. HUAS TT20 TaxID=3447509 RepID=UPI0021D9490A|nr:TFIIB-type zinc ribbon-containing protein [Streptomyces sp. HUAS 15-9]UXY28850.1 TFIIB-type zinc ribbon-containing protein [Streptomyces sp. HUAS 15-9]
MSQADSAAEGPALWIGSLLRRYPELVAELAPAAHGGLRERRGGGPVGGTTVPVRLHVSDVLRDLTDGVVELEEAVRERLGLRPLRPAPVPVRLRRIAGLLERIAADPVLAAHVEDETRRMAARCVRVLGDPEQMVRLPGRCPGCGSVSLRAFPERAQVRCVNPACVRVLQDRDVDEEVTP